MSNSSEMQNVVELKKDSKPRISKQESQIHLEKLLNGDEYSKYGYGPINDLLNYPLSKKFEAISTTESPLDKPMLVQLNKTEKGWNKILPTDEEAIAAFLTKFLCENVPDRLRQYKLSFEECKIAIRMWAHNNKKVKKYPCFSFIDDTFPSFNKRNLKPILIDTSSFPTISKTSSEIESHINDIVIDIFKQNKDNFKSFYEFSMRTDDPLALILFVGACCTQKSHRKKTLLLHGPGGGGKTTFVISMMQAIFGKDGVADFSGNDLKDKFNHPKMIGKRVTFIDEIHNKFFSDNIFKNLTGASCVNMQPKFGQPFSVELDTMTISSQNGKLHIENTPEMMERIMPLRVEPLDKNATRISSQIMLDTLEIEAPYIVGFCLSIFNYLNPDNGPIPHNIKKLTQHMENHELEVDGLIDHYWSKGIKGKGREKGDYILTNEFFDVMRDKKFNPEQIEKAKELFFIKFDIDEPKKMRCKDGGQVRIFKGVKRREDYGRKIIQEAEITSQEIPYSDEMKDRKEIELKEFKELLENESHLQTLIQLSKSIRGAK